MKILMISEYFPPNGKGGGEISAKFLAGALAKKGIDIHVLTSHFGRSKEYELVDGIKVHRRLRTGASPSTFLGNFERNMFFRKSLLKELYSLDKKEDFDIIHCMNSTSIYAIELKEKIDKIFILHANSPRLFCPKATLMYKDKGLCDKKCDFWTFFPCYISSRMFGKITLNPLLKFNPAVIYAIRKPYADYQRLIKKFDHYVAISTFLKDQLIKSGAPGSDIDIVYNIVELDKFMELKKTKEDIKKESAKKIKRILYLGEYSRPKGPDLLVDALKKVRLPYQADFFGSGALLEELKKESLGFPIKINDKASYESIPKIISEHDIVVVPSLVGEGFSRVALEAVFAGKIVVASNIGGIPDVVNKKTGFLVDNLDEMPKKIEEAMRSDIIPVAEDKFREEDIVNGVIDIYKKLI